MKASHTFLVLAAVGGLLFGLFYAQRKRTGFSRAQSSPVLPVTLWGSVPIATLPSPSSANLYASGGMFP